MKPPILELEALPQEIQTKLAAAVRDDPYGLHPESLANTIAGSLQLGTRPKSCSEIYDVPIEVVEAIEQEVCRK